MEVKEIYLKDQKPELLPVLFPSLNDINTWELSSTDSEPHEDDFSGPGNVKLIIAMKKYFCWLMTMLCHIKR